MYSQILFELKDVSNNMYVVILNNIMNITL